MAKTREELVADMVERTRKTPEQINAWLDVLASAMIKRGWHWEGKVLSDEETAEKVKLFLGES